jgi:hypothetical protein
MSSVTKWMQCCLLCGGLLACAEDVSEPNRPHGSPSLAEAVTPGVTKEGCEILECPHDPPDKPDFAGSLHNYDTSTALSEPISPPDPSPGAEGMWLNLNHQDCWEPYYSAGSSHSDRDLDGFDDNCEFRLAQAFAPMIRFSGSEECSGGEAYWGAKYFDNIEPYHTGDFVRLAYLMSYYKDCGELGHIGDSEFIQLTVTFVPTTKHWKLINSWISAHAVIGHPFGNSILGPVGSNSSTWGDQFEWPSGRRYSYPRIWVSDNKHANYRT